MYKKIWKEEHLHNFHAPLEVKRRIKELIDILCSHYGAGRNVDLELGGFIAAFTDDSPVDARQCQELLEKHRLNESAPEYRETILETGNGSTGTTWTEMLFLCGSDYAIVLIQNEGPRIKSQTGIDRVYQRNG